ncbi:MAG: PD-(D/E)XK nuclease family protein [Acidimicrobiales bacterium]
MPPVSPATTPVALATALSAAIARAKGDDTFAPVTVVAPSGYAAVWARRAVACTGVEGRRGVANVTFTTPGDLVRRLGSPGLSRGDRRVAPGPVLLEALRTVADDAGDPWRRVASTAPARHRLMGAVDELQRLSPSQLEALAHTPGRGGGVVRLAVALRAHLHARHYVTVADLREEAIEAVRAASLRELAAFGPLVLFDEPSPAPAEVAVLELLAAANGAERLSAPPWAGVDEVVRCADTEQEVRAAVGVVVGRLEAGVALWRQAVAHPPGARYARIVHQELEAAGIATGGPVFRRLDRSAPGRALVGLLDLAGSEWRRDEVIAWLGSTPLLDPRSGDTVPVSRWHVLSADAGVVGGLAQWRARLTQYGDDALAGELRVQPGTEQAEADASEALLAFVEDLAAVADPPRGGWRAHVAWAEQLLDRYVDVAALEKVGPEGRLAFDQVRHALRSLAELDAVTGPPDMAALRRAVRAQLEQHRVDLRDLGARAVGDGVFVGTFAQLRGMRFDTVVLVGMADSIVPGALGDDPLLPDDLRRGAPGGTLLSRAERQEELRDQIGAAVAAGEERRIALVPLVDERTGREQVPSRWIAELSSRGAAIRTVPSFAASLSEVTTPTSGRDRVLGELHSTALRGRDVRGAAPALADGRLAGAIEIVRARLGHRFTRFDGFVGCGLVTPFDPERPVSPTRLEVYAECPRKFLFDRVLYVKRRILPEERWRIQSLERGSLVHLVLERYVLARLDGAPRSLEVLESIAAQCLDAAEARGITGRALLWRVDRAAIERDLRTFYEEEGDCQPLAAEFSFGGGSDDTAQALAVELPDGRVVRFRGQADRVDEEPDGTLVVSDYKTGKQTTLKSLSGDPVMGGRKLQLPVYALAARATFGPDSPVRARYWMVSGERTATFYTLEFTDEIDAHFRDVLLRIATAVDEGLFPAIPGPQTMFGFEGCRFCDFDHVCPPTRDRQWESKRSSPELAAVHSQRDVEVPESLLGAVVRLDAPTRRGP